MRSILLRNHLNETYLSKVRLHGKIFLSRLKNACSGMFKKLRLKALLHVETATNAMREKKNCSRYLSADIGWELSKNSKRESPVMKYFANH